MIFPTLTFQFIPLTLCSCSSSLQLLTYREKPQVEEVDVRLGIIAQNRTEGNYRFQLHDET